MSKGKRILGSIAIAVVAVGAFLGYQVYRTNAAHSSFENYYAFRGCQELIEKTDSFATCRLADGSIIKLVLINNKWYLDGDGPGIW